MNIRNEVYQAIVAFFQEGQEEASKVTQIEVQLDGNESEPYYRAWIHRQTGLIDPESGSEASLLTWAKFSYINGNLTLIAGSWEHILANQMRKTSNLLQKQAEESRLKSGRAVPTARQVTVA